MGTTLTSLWMLNGQAFFTHVGDSRLYHWRQGKLRRITQDHTRANFAVRDGRPPDSNGAFLAQNFVYGSRGFGNNKGIRVDAGKDTGVIELEIGDRLMLCSDGLSGMVPDHRIGDVLSEVPGPQPAATALMERALAAGSNDNVTVIVARVDALFSRQVVPMKDPGVDDDTLVPMD
jgi:protein phosphatase